MSALAISLIVFGSTAAASLFGATLRKLLPEHHLDSESRDVVKLVIGLIATISALVLSLLIASASSSYNAQEAQLQKLAVDVVQLDRILQGYGPDAQQARMVLREVIVTAHDRIWSSNGLGGANLAAQDVQAGADKLAGALRALSPKTDFQQFARNQALDLGLNLAQTRVLMLETAGGSIPWPFLAVLVGWISMLFLGFGLLSRFHATVAAALLIGAASVAAAVFLILQLNNPYGGVMHLSDLPMRRAISLLGSVGSRVRLNAEP